MHWNAAVWGAVGGVAAAIVALVLQLGTDRHPVFDDPRGYFLGWFLSLGCQAVLGGLVAGLVSQGLSSFLTGLTALGLLAYVISQFPVVQDWSSQP